jgi:DNA repair ATPase RecN
MLTEQEFEQKVRALVLDGQLQGEACIPDEAVTLLAAYREQAQALEEAREQLRLCHIDQLNAEAECNTATERLHRLLNVNRRHAELNEALIDQRDALEKRVAQLEEQAIRRLTARAEGA